VAGRCHQLSGKDKVMLAEVEQGTSTHNTGFRDFVANQSNGSEPGAALSPALNACLSTGMEVVSVLPEWVELRVPCDLAAISPLQKLLTQLEADLPKEIGEAISYAFREMLSNAVEYGCRLDPAKRVEVRFIRLKRAVICRIKDPGEGFDPIRLDHAAVNNPNQDPLRHAFVREEKGMRAGGFGILLTTQLVMSWSITSGITKCCSSNTYLELGGRVDVSECEASNFNHHEGQGL
jgi:anti-sigma regulatory factor (Ser/Thr protein kinase)